MKVANRFTKKSRSSAGMNYKIATLCAALCWVFACVGCSTAASQSSQSAREFVRDPLGIDRAINEYYFPNGAPQNQASEFNSGSGTKN